MSYREIMNVGRANNNTLLVLCLGIFLAAVDQTVVVTVLPDIIDTLQGGFSSSGVERAGWIVTAYLFGYAVVLPLMGRVADRYGHRLTYSLALGIFTIGSLLCAVSWSLFGLVGFRALQAVGGGALVPITMAVVGHQFPEKRRALALGIIGAAGEAGAVFGPLYGSLLGQYIGWRAIFYLNLPLALLIFLLIRHTVRESPRYDVRIDYRSGVLFALALGTATAAVSGGSELGWQRFSFPLLGLSLIFLISFILSDLRSSSPLVNLSLFSNRPFASANIAHFLLGVALITALVQVPSFAYSSGWPQSADSAPIIGGVLLIRLTLMIPVGALAGGILSARRGVSQVAAAGFILSAFALWRTSGWSVDVGPLRQTTDLLICGFGFGLVIAPIGLAVISSVKKSRMASAAAVLTATRIIGMTAGLAALNSWGISEFRAVRSREAVPLPSIGMSLARYLDQLRLWEQKNVAAILSVLSDFFLIAAAACLLAVIPSLMLKARKPGTIQPPGSTKP
jgi:EmrB/QacA subfamily drug resistance transporter